MGVKVLLLFCSLNTISVLWSNNTPRATLEAGFLWLIFLLFIAIIVRYAELYKARRLFINTIWLTTVMLCLFAWWQIFGEAYGAPPEVTLLPNAYQSDVFGFARPTGFAIEPQFFGNLLLAPLMLATHTLLKNSKNLRVTILLFIAAATLVATISRGAFIAAVVGLLVIFALTKTTAPRRLKAAGTLVIGATISLCLIGFAAHANPTDQISGPSAIAGAVNQTSLGAIDLKPLMTAQNQSKEPVATEQRAPSPPSSPKETATPTYVVESTTSRLLMSQEALKLMNRDTFTFMFGVGVGGFGAAIHQKNTTYALGSVVNNEYLQVASELGLIGLVLFGTLLLLPVYGLLKLKQWPLLSLLLAFYTQWFFFSGHINTLHIWLTLAIAYSILLQSKHYSNADQSA